MQPQNDWTIRKTSVVEYDWRQRDFSIWWSVPASSPSSTTISTFKWNVSLPPKLEIHSGNLSKVWKQWRQVWDEEVTVLRIRQIAFASPPSSHVLERKRLNFIMVFRSQVKKRNPAWRGSSSYGKPIALEKPTLFIRYKFHNRLQEQTESIEAYVNALRGLAETCDFGALKDQLIRDRFECGVR